MTLGTVVYELPNTLIRGISPIEGPDPSTLSVVVYVFPPLPGLSRLLH